MKKNNKLGFMLVETLVATTIIFSALIFLYIQFRTINNSYNKTFSYNTANSLYAVNHIKQYLLDTGYYDLTLALQDNEFIDITNCPVQYLTEITYCQSLFEKLSVKKVIFTKQDISDLKALILQTRPLEEELINYINYIKYDDEIDKYRLIVQFNDDTYASLKVY